MRIVPQEMLFCGQLRFGDGYDQGTACRRLRLGVCADECTRHCSWPFMQQWRRVQHDVSPSAFFPVSLECGDMARDVFLLCRGMILRVG